MSEGFLGPHWSGIEGAPKGRRQKKRIFYGQAGGSATFWRDSVSEKLATNFETKIFKFRRLLGWHAICRRSKNDLHKDTTTSLQMCSKMCDPKKSKLHFCLQRVTLFIVWLQAKPKIQIFWTSEPGPIMDDITFCKTNAVAGLSIPSGQKGRRRGQAPSAPAFPNNFAKTKITTKQQMQKGTTFLLTPYIFHQQQLRIDKLFRPVYD